MTSHGIPPSLVAEGQCLSVSNEHHLNAIVPVSAGRFGALTSKVRLSLEELPHPLGVFDEPPDASEMIPKCSVAPGKSKKAPGEEQFQVLLVWRRDSSDAVAKNTQMPGSRAMANALGTQYTKHGERQWGSWTSNDLDEALYKKPSTRWVCIRRHLPVHPNSMRRCGWDIISLLLVAYDVAVIPLALFDIPKNSFFSLMKWFTRIFWSLDIPASFLTGFLRADGNCEDRFRPIAQRYIRTWFILDLAIVVSDWAEFVASSGGDSVSGLARLMRTSRTIRMLRMIRLLRLIRMPEVFGMITERIRSEKLILFAHIFKVLIMILGVAHLFCCFWYGIGLQSVEAGGAREERNWIAGKGILYEPFGYRYTTAFHWSFSQFTGGMDEVQPQNVQERLYAIMVLMFGFVSASSFISSLTSAMTKLQIIAGRSTTEFTTLRRYLLDACISHKLSIRIQRNAKHAVAEQARCMTEQAVELLRMVSEPLRVELHFELYAHVFNKHHFFKQYVELCPAAMRKVCHHAVSVKPLSRDDVVFSFGEIPAHPQMLICMGGTLRYVAAIDETETEVTADSASSWVAEATLWTHWMHRGILAAVSDARLLVVNAKDFQDIAIQFPTPGFDPKRYASDFVAQLNESENLTDLHSKPEEHGDDWMNHQPTAGHVPIRRGLIRSLTRVIEDQIEIQHQILDNNFSADDDVGQKSTSSF